MKGSTVGIIGMGWVGSSIAISLLQNGVTKNLLLNDVREGIAEGEAMDLNHGSSFLPAFNARSASIREMHNCDVVVVTAGRGGKPGESRLELLKENIEITRKISEELLGFRGVLVVVSNPVDVLTYYYQKFTGLPVGKVIGTGTFLDSVRLREMIGEEMGIEPKSIQADVLGEHGDSSVMFWSKASIGGISLRNWEDWNPEREGVFRDKVRKAAQEIIRRKGATNHAIGLVTASLVKYILRDDRRVVTLSVVIEEAYGLKDVALSLPCLVGGNGVERVLEPRLDEQEHEQLMHSAEVLRRAIQSVEA